MPETSSSQRSSWKKKTGKGRVGSKKTNNKGPKTYFCYLLRSINKIYKTSTYIGFTVNPRRRIRQHNGEIKNGAKKTRRKRPWQMLCNVWGFPTKIAALQFEWAWQNPRKSRLVKQAAASRKFAAGPLGRVQLMYEMLNLQPWCRYPLHVLHLDPQFYAANSCLLPPEHMDVTLGSFSDLPMYQNTSSDVEDTSDDSGVDSDDDSDIEACHQAFELNDSFDDTLEGQDFDSLETQYDWSQEQKHMSRSNDTRGNFHLEEESEDNRLDLTQHCSDFGPSRSQSTQNPRTCPEVEPIATLSSDWACQICGPNSTKALAGRAKLPAKCVLCGTKHHLLCLANLFIAEQHNKALEEKTQATRGNNVIGLRDKSLACAPLLPLGGKCPSCDKYILWSSVIERIRTDRLGAEFPPYCFDQIATKLERKAMMASLQNIRNRDKFGSVSNKISPGSATICPPFFPTNSTSPASSGSLTSSKRIHRAEAQHDTASSKKHRHLGYNKENNHSQDDCHGAL